MNRRQPLPREIETDDLDPARAVVRDVLSSSAAPLEHRRTRCEVAEKERPQRIDIAEPEPIGERALAAELFPVRRRGARLDVPVVHLQHGIALSCSARYVNAVPFRI